MTKRLPFIAISAAMLASVPARSAGVVDDASPIVIPAPLPSVSGSLASSPPSAPEVSSAPAIPLVAFDQLIPFLPSAPAGWAAEPAQGTTTEIDDLKLSTAQRSYHMGDADEPPTASVTIIDFAKNQRYLDGITSVWQLKLETPDGYDKPVEIDGVRGFEHYAKAAQAGSLTAIVAGRFFIQVELTKRDPKELRDWFKRIDLKKLAALK